MSDRELLELSAKAAGFGLPGPDDCDEISRQYDYHLGLWVKFPWGWAWFRPHIDDGQALRLAVKLMEFEPYISRGNLPLFSPDLDNTRRAIVRSAAEIGRQMDAAISAADSLK